MLNLVTKLKQLVLKVSHLLLKLRQLLSKFSSLVVMSCKSLFARHQYYQMEPSQQLNQDFLQTCLKVYLAYEGSLP